MRKIINHKSPNFYIVFQLGSQKNYRRIFFQFFFTFIYSQNHVNLLVGHNCDLLIRSSCAPTTFYLFKKGAILIGPSAIFLGPLGMPLIETSLWTPPLQNRNKCAPLNYIVYIIQRSSTLGKPYEIKVLLGISWEMHLGTL